MSLTRISTNLRTFCLAFFATALVTFSFTSCEEGTTGEGPTETDFTDLLSNQIDQVIIPTMTAYRSAMADFLAAVNGFASSIDENNLANVRMTYQQAYLAYQAAAVHNYFATANQSLVNTSNLYPVDVTLLESLIESESYLFNAAAQERANGFPALDYLLYGPTDVLDYFNGDSKRMAFLQALVNHMKEKSDGLVIQWEGDLSTNFVNNGGTALGSSISVQLNESLVYYEMHVRENKVGIPIGRLGPNDSPIPADATKIEGYYQYLFDGNEDFTFDLLKASIEEMEDLYLGTTSAGADNQGYDDLLVARGQSAINTDIKTQFTAIYNEINRRTSISGNDDLYNVIQGLITLYKTDLFPVLNVQDADGANDGD